MLTDRVAKVTERLGDVGDSGLPWNGGKLQVLCERQHGVKVVDAVVANDDNVLAGNATQVRA